MSWHFTNPKRAVNFGDDSFKFNISRSLSGTDCCELTLIFKKLILLRTMQHKMIDSQVVQLQTQVCSKCIQSVDDEFTSPLSTVNIFLKLAYPIAMSEFFWFLVVTKWKGFE